MIGCGPTITYCPTLHLLLKNGRLALPEDAELLGELAERMGEALWSGVVGEGWQDG